MRHLLIAFIVLMGFATALSAQRSSNGRATAVPSSPGGGQRSPSASPQTSPRSTERSPRTTPRSSQTTTTPRSSSSSTADRSSGTTTPASQSKTTVPGSPQQDYHPIVPNLNTPKQPNMLLNSTQTSKNIGNEQVKAPSLNKRSPEAGKVNWMTLEQALEKSKTEKRKIFVDVYTDWCGWCKRMDSTTFVNPAVAKYLNERFYPVKFNAEQQQDITLNGKTYKFKKSGQRGHHELAAEWLNNRLSFPTIVFLDENQQLIQPIPGFQDATKTEAIMNYFGGDNHKKTPWESYEKSFISGQR